MHFLNNIVQPINQFRVRFRGFPHDVRGQPRVHSYMKRWFWFLFLNEPYMSTYQKAKRISWLYIILYEILINNCGYLELKLAKTEPSCWNAPPWCFHGNSTSFEVNWTFSGWLLNTMCYLHARKRYFSAHVKICRDTSLRSLYLATVSCDCSAVWMVKCPKFGYHGDTCHVRNELFSVLIYNNNPRLLMCKSNLIDMCNKFWTISNKSPPPQSSSHNLSNQPHTGASVRLPSNGIYNKCQTPCSHSKSLISTYCRF